MEDFTNEQIAAVETFQTEHGIATRSEALRMLLDIALDTVSAKGDRFWDQRPEKARGVPGRRRIVDHPAPNFNVLAGTKANEG